VRAISIIFRRELGAYLKSPVGYVIAALALLVNGLLFYTQALGTDKARLSGEILSQFFYFSSGCIIAAALLLSMRLVAQERQTGTLVLLNTSPVRDSEIVIGKFLSAFAFLALITLLTLYMPLLIMVRGKISLGHVMVGYLGLLLLGGATLAIGMFTTSLAPDQLTAGLVGLVLVVVMIVLYPLAKQLNAPLRPIFEQMALHQTHFWPFMRGILHVKHVVYHFAVIYFFLLLATKTLEAKRWQ
jgi:ABC-2 type transport system permease protein